MAINIDAQNIDKYPGTLKRVTIDLDQIVPLAFEGDEQFVLTVATSAYSDNAARTAIPTTYVSDLKIGWIKSSGLTGIGGRFALDSNTNSLKVKMDATVSGSDGSGYYTITLNYNTDGTSIRGEVIASDLEEKIREIQCVAADAGYQKAYTNTSVEWKDGKFWIISGTIGRYYTGEYKSSVDAVGSDISSCAKLLGFNTPVKSEHIASVSIAESLIVADYVGDYPYVYINNGTGVKAGDCLSITDGTKLEYFPVIAVSGTRLTVPTSTVNGFTAIIGNYTLMDYARVQILREQDPDVTPTPYCSSVDALIRYGVKNTINLIDFSS